MSQYVETVPTAGGGQPSNTRSASNRTPPRRGSSSRSCSSSSSGRCARCPGGCPGGRVQRTGQLEHRPTGARGSSSRVWKPRLVTRREGQRLPSKSLSQPSITPVPSMTEELPRPGPTNLTSPSWPSSSRWRGRFPPSGFGGGSIATWPGGIPGTDLALSARDCSSRATSGPAGCSSSWPRSAFRSRLPRAGRAASGATGRGSAARSPA